MFTEQEGKNLNYWASIDVCARGIARDAQSAGNIAGQLSRREILLVSDYYKSALGLVKQSADKTLKSTCGS